MTVDKHHEKNANRMMIYKYNIRCSVQLVLKQCDEYM